MELYELKYKSNAKIKEHYSDYMDIIQDLKRKNLLKNKDIKNK